MQRQQLNWYVSSLHLPDLFLLSFPLSPLRYLSPPVANARVNCVFRYVTMNASTFHRTNLYRIQFSLPRALYSFPLLSGSCVNGVVVFCIILYNCTVHIITLRAQWWMHFQLFSDGIFSLQRSVFFCSSVLNTIHPRKSFIHMYGEL